MLCFLLQDKSQSSICAETISQADVSAAASDLSALLNVRLCSVVCKNSCFKKEDYHLQGGLDHSQHPCNTWHDITCAHAIWYNTISETVSHTCLVCHYSNIECYYPGVSILAITYSIYRNRMQPEFPKSVCDLK